MQNREQFVVPEVVPWSKVGDALGYYFLSHTGRGLTHYKLLQVCMKGLCILSDHMFGYYRNDSVSIIHTLVT